METKTPTETLVIMNELVMPNDTNIFNNLMGGRLMYWMDIASALSSMKFCGKPVVTASVDHLSFQNPILRGNVVKIQAKVTRSFRTSMEVHLKVWGESPLKQNQYQSNEAFFTFVALGENGKPIPVPKIKPETEEEQKLYEGAEHRRVIRLILSGKIKAKDAEEELRDFILNG